MSSPSVREAPPGQNNFNTQNGMYLRISGGYLVIDASGDGLDSNGPLTIEGGTVLVCGPTDSANSAMDYDGTGEITGGVVVCVGSSGMAMGFSSSSSQPSLMYTFGSAKEGGTSVALTDESGAVLASFTPGKSYQNVIISAPGMAQGSSYNLVTGGTATDEDGNGYAAAGTVSGGDTVSVTLSSVSIAISENGSSAGGMGGNMGGMAPNGNGGGTMPPGGQR